MAKKKKKAWIVTSYVKEKYEVIAETRKEALECIDLEDPYDVEVINTSCIRNKEYD